MIAEPSMPERRPSPGLTLNLNSNNPFRNRAASPAFPSPALNTPSSAGSRPMSRNPFLSTFESEFNKQAANPNLIDMSANMKDSPKKATFGNSAEELFNNLTLDDSSKRAPAPAPRGPPGRSDTLPAKGHRPTASEEERRMRGPPRPRGPPGARPARDSPERRERRRPRRNSESSMIDKGSLDPEEERKRRERRRERDARSKDGKSRSGKVRRPQGLDLIDKLDVSGIYGPSMFHHDGPFDACNPHRNRKKDQRAPMQAFPVGSANNALGGSGPVNKHIDLETFHGRGAEGFTDFGGPIRNETFKEDSADKRTTAFNPKGPEIIHGQESAGLGTSTFLDGAPASRAAIQRRESENEAAAIQNGGLGRKKSIAQRFRGISQSRRGGGAFGSDGQPRIVSPNERWEAGKAQSAGGMARTNETNPFFEDYDDAYEKKGATIKIAEPQGRDGTRSPSSPPGRNGLTRAMTADSYDTPDASKSNGGGAGGFLTRMKSLKGGKRARPERPA